MKLSTLIPLVSLILGSYAQYTCKQDLDKNGYPTIDPATRPGRCVGNGQNVPCSKYNACFKNGAPCTITGRIDANCGSLRPPIKPNHG
ncbi:hypothetical protein PTT_19272 [Pyrenophora teres f. teres 0-1]|uniref:Antifungal protein n=1 Tax=Pyrenophora teres f. teres (strain 0-1) TaxID=861557 RepID=E3S8I4_PYRTT|nr:hypothetical protein PTT_19272 [Pyrenophora teres f. teres 0-1]